MPTSLRDTISTQWDNQAQAPTQGLQRGSRSLPTLNRTGQTPYGTAAPQTDFTANPLGTGGANPLQTGVTPSAPPPNTAPTPAPDPRMNLGPNPFAPQQSVQRIMQQTPTEPPTNPLPQEGGPTLPPSDTPLYDKLMRGRAPQLPPGTTPVPTVDPRGERYTTGQEHTTPTNPREYQPQLPPVDPRFLDQPDKRGMYTYGPGGQIIPTGPTGPGLGAGGPNTGGDTTGQENTTGPGTGGIDPLPPRPPTGRGGLAAFMAGDDRQIGRMAPPSTSRFEGGFGMNPDNRSPENLAPATPPPNTAGPPTDGSVDPWVSQTIRPPISGTRTITPAERVAQARALRARVATP